MSHQVIIYDQSLNLAMLLTVLMTGYTFMHVSNMKEVKQNFNKLIELIIVVENENSNELLDLVEALKIKNDQLKVMYLAQQDLNLKMWKTKADIILSDWNLADERIIKSIKGLLD